MTNTEIINSIHEIMANEKMITWSEGIYGGFLRAAYVLDVNTESAKNLFKFFESVADFIWNDISDHGTYYTVENENEKEIDINIFTPEYYNSYTGRKF